MRLFLKKTAETAEKAKTVETAKTAETVETLETLETATVHHQSLLRRAVRERPRAKDRAPRPYPLPPYRAFAPLGTAILNVPRFPALCWGATGLPIKPAIK